MPHAERLWHSCACDNLSLCQRLERALDPWMSQFANALREAAALPFYRATAMILASL